MKLDEAIDAVRAAMPKHRAIEMADMNRPRPDYADRAIATILNAVLDGSLIREAEVRGMERAAQEVEEWGAQSYDDAIMQAAADVRAKAAAIRGEGK